MSEEQLKAFLEKVKGDTSLQEKLKKTGDIASIVAIANAAGFMISVDDFNIHQNELTDNELESINGGSASCWTGTIFGLSVDGLIPYMGCGY